MILVDSNGKQVMAKLNIAFCFGETLTVLCVFFFLPYNSQEEESLEHQMRKPWMK